MDASGEAVPNLKGRYDSATSELRIEGLHEGDYRLLVLGIRGDAAADGVTVRPIRHLDEEWLTFPETLDSPLAAEYFYSQTPLRVVVHEGVPTGTRREVILAGRSCSAALSDAWTSRSRSATPMSARPSSARRWRSNRAASARADRGGELTGEGTVQLRTLAPGRETAWLLPPTVGGYGTAGRG